MKKRALAIILSLTFILTMVMSIPAFAAGNVTLSKTQFTVGEKGQATVSGLTAEQIEDGAYLGIVTEGTRHENTLIDTYVSNLPANNVWTFEAPTYFGNYELRLMDADYNLLSSAAFTVAAPKANANDITISKKEVKLNEPMSVTVNGLTDEMLENGAWLGIARYDEKLSNTLLDAYIANLPANNTYEFEAPYKCSTPTQLPPHLTC